MAIITCSCGNKYDDSFKFCPECATPNPNIQKKPKLKEVSDDTQAPVRKSKFVKVGESNMRSSSSTWQEVTPKNAKPVRPQKPVKPEYEDEDEDEDEEIEETKYAMSSTEYEDYEDEDEDEEEEDSSEEYEDEDEQEDDEEEEEDYTPSFKASSKALGAPAVKPIKQPQPKNTPKPKTKSINASTKSSLNKKQKNYDPNNDGYYDDRLPAILDEVTKTSHLDVILKISLAVVCIAALIVYCIFYVQV